jgi:ADP-ribose pyrophosphatase YjhB (NUDIX family)
MATVSSSVLSKSNETMALSQIPHPESDIVPAVSALQDNGLLSLLFSPTCLEYDHYNGVTIDLECVNDDEGMDGSSSSSSSSLTFFHERLERQLQLWKTEGNIRGVWIHIPPHLAAYVPICIDNGFNFHSVTPTATITNDSNGTAMDDNSTTTATTATTNNNVLILSQWLPDSTSRLPVGPTHQVGVGCLIWHPDDSPTLGPQRRLLVVQEKSGPAATFQLWKLPTGLADPNENIHDAAIRELYEETGLVGLFDGLLLVRQAHPNVTPPTTNTNVTTISTTTAKQEHHAKRSQKKSVVQRKVSDLFFVCHMTLQQQQSSTTGGSDETSRNTDNNNTPIWTACPTEIAAIQWMPVQEYCQQQRWQSSPLYMELNRVILDTASTTTSVTVASNQNE